MEEVQRVKWCVSWEAGFIFEATGEELSVLCQTSFLYCCEMWEFTVADEARLHVVERCMIKMMCEVRLVDRVLTDVLPDRVGLVVKIEYMIIQNRLQWYGHAWRHQFPNR